VEKSADLNNFWYTHPEKKLIFKQHSTVISIEQLTFPKLSNIPTILIVLKQ